MVAGDDPFTNVVVLRLIVAPLWFGIIPMITFAEVNWDTLRVALAQAKTSQLEELRSRRNLMARVARRQRTHGRSNSFCNLLINARATIRAYLLVAPVVLWVTAVGAMLGAAINLYLTQNAFIAPPIGAVCGFLITHSESFQRHWYEVCYWGHLFVAYVTVAIALVARFDVFWPCAACWSLVALDRCVLMPCSTYTCYIQAAQSRVISPTSLELGQTGGKIRLVLRAASHSAAKTFSTEGASNWVYLRVGGLDERARPLERRVLRAWHPLSIAGTTNGNIELFINVHGKGSWSDKLAQSIRNMQQQDEARLRDEEVHEDIRYDPNRCVRVIGPLGSSFSRCFEMRRRKAQHATPAYDIVILYGCGIGVPSAISALREFIERRMYGTQVPSYVYLLWQTKYAEDLLLCWDSLHRAIFEAGGLWSEEQYAQHKEVFKRANPIDLDRHKRRNNGEPWWAGDSGDNEQFSSPLLEWLGVSLAVSRMGKGGGRHMLEQDNPLQALGGAGNEVHRWLTHPARLREGYAALNVEVCKLVREFQEQFGRHENNRPPRVCVSMCGSPMMAAKAAQELKTARSLLLSNVGQEINIRCELMADSH